MLKEVFSSKFQEQNMIADLIIIQEGAGIRQDTQLMKTHYQTLATKKKS